MWTDTCPASPTHEGGVPAYRQAGRATLSKTSTFPGSPALQGLCRNMKTPLFGKGERRSGEKDLERQPLTVWIQGRQPYEYI